MVFSRLNGSEDDFTDVVLTKFAEKKRERARQVGHKLSVNPVMQKLVAVTNNNDEDEHEHDEDNISHMAQEGLRERRKL